MDIFHLVADTLLASPDVVEEAMDAPQVVLDTLPPVCFQRGEQMASGVLYKAID